MSIFGENWIRGEIIVCKTNNRQLRHTDGNPGIENGTEEYKEKDGKTHYKNRND